MCQRSVTQNYTTAQKQPSKPLYQEQQIYRSVQEEPVVSRCMLGHRPLGVGLLVRRHSRTLVLKDSPNTNRERAPVTSS